MLTCANKSDSTEAVAATSFNLTDQMGIIVAFQPGALE